MDYTFRVRLSHIQVTSLVTLVQLISCTEPQHVACFRLAFDGKVEDVPLEPDLITGDLTSRRDIRFVYRIRADSPQELEASLSRRYATCQILLKARMAPTAAASGVGSSTPQEPLSVVAVLASATASVLELVRSTDPHFLFTLTEVARNEGYSTDGRGRADQEDPSYIDSTDASVCKEDDGAQDSQIGAVLGRKDGLVSLRLAVEEMRVVDVAFHDAVHVSALPALSTVQLAYKVRHTASSATAEQLGISTAGDCRSKGYTLSTTSPTTSSAGAVTFAASQLPRLTPSKFTPHDLTQHELEVCVLVSGSLYATLHLPLTTHDAQRAQTEASLTYTNNHRNAQTVSLSLTPATASDWDASGVALDGALTLSNIPCFLEALEARTQVPVLTAATMGAAMPSPQPQLGGSSSSAVTAPQTPHMVAPGAVVLGNVTEQVLRPLTPASATTSLASSLCVAGPSAAENVTSAESRGPNRPARGQEEGVTVLSTPVPPESSSIIWSASPPEQVRTMIGHSTNSSPTQKDTATPDANIIDDTDVRAATSSIRPPPPPPPLGPTDEIRVASPNASNINADPQELLSVDDDGSHPLTPNSSIGTAARSRRSSASEAVIAPTTAATVPSLPNSRAVPAPLPHWSSHVGSLEDVLSTCANTLPVEARQAAQSAPQSTSARQLSTTSRGSVATVSEDLVLHFQPQASTSAETAQHPPNGQPLDKPRADGTDVMPDTDADTASSAAPSRTSRECPREPLVDGREVSPQPQPQPPQTMRAVGETLQTSSSTSPSLAPPARRQSAWQPGPEPLPPVPRLGPSSRAPRKSSAVFARTHTKLVADGHAFRTLLAAYESQQRRVQEAEEALSDHETRYAESAGGDVSPHTLADDLQRLKAQERQEAAQLELNLNTVRSLEKQLLQLRESVAANTKDVRPASSDAEGGEDGSLTKEEAERLSLYAELMTSLSSLLTRAERHHDELTATRDRRSLQRLADAQASFEADSVSCAHLVASSPLPSGVLSEPPRRCASVNFGPNTSDHVASEVAVIPAHTVSPAPPPTAPPMPHERRPSPLSEDRQSSSPAPPSPTTATRAPNPPSAAPPGAAHPRARSPLYSAVVASSASTVQSPLAHTDTPTSPPRSHSVVVGFSQPCTPEAERRAREAWQRHQDALQVHQDGTLAFREVGGGGHPYAAATAGQPVYTSPTFRYGSSVLVASTSSAHRPGEQTQPAWEEEEAAAHATAASDGRSALGVASGLASEGARQHSLVCSPVVNLFPRLGSRAASADRERGASPAPRAPSPELSQPPALAKTVLRSVLPQPSSQPAPPLSSLLQSRAHAPVTTPSAVTTTGSAVLDTHHGAGDRSVAVGGRPRTPQRPSTRDTPRYASFTPDNCLSEERTPSHPYSIPREYDGADHYPLVSADDNAVSATALQVRALMQAIAEGDADTSLHLMTRSPEVLHGSENFLHAACGAPISREEIVRRILDLRPELARGVDRESGSTALHVACGSASPSLRVIRQLILAGVDARVRNRQGDTAFHVAVRNRADALTHSVKEILLAMGGSTVNERTESGQTALHLVAGSDENFTVVQFLVTHGADLWARAPVDVFVGSPYGYKGRERLTKTVTPPEAASLKGAIRNGRYFDRSLMNSRIQF